MIDGTDAALQLNQPLASVWGCAKPRSLTLCCSALSQAEGARGFYRGWQPNVIRAAVVNIGELATVSSITLEYLCQGQTWMERGRLCMPRPFFFFFFFFFFLLFLLFCVTFCVGLSHSRHHLFLPVFFLTLSFRLVRRSKAKHQGTDNVGRRSRASYMLGTSVTARNRG